MSDRSRDVSPALTEVRTVLSRAETALTQLAYLMPIQQAGSDYHGPVDQDHEEMAEALRDVVSRLEKWRKAGKRRVS